MSQGQQVAGADPFAGADGAMWRHPQPTYELMREHAPILRQDGAGVVVSRRADVDEVLRNPDAFSSAMSAADLQNVRPLIPLQIDPPDHKKFRKLLDPLFAPQRMKELEASVVRLVHERIDSFIDAGQIDFAAQFSVPLPSEIFLTLLGLPLDDLPVFIGMKDGIIRPHAVVGAEMGSPEAVAHQKVIADSIYDYFNRVLDARRDERPPDLLSHFLDVEVEGDRLSREDILDICFLLLIAGLDTVTASLDCFYAFLAEHPDRRRELVEDPSLIPAAVEELLRWETPVVAVPRIATRDTEISGFPISAGEHVLAFLGSANTDEAELSDAAEVRWDREVNKHLGFGGGVHRCLGSHLARLELRVALREWHARIPDYRITPGVELDFTAGIRSVEGFPMTLGVSV